MENSRQLATRLREVFLDGKWIANTNYQKVLSDVDWKEANHQIADLNTIGLLSFHLNYYLQGVLQVFKGGELTISDKYSFDAPALETEADWNALKKSIANNALELATIIEMLKDDELNKTFVLAQYGNYRRNIEGLIEHGYYHLGQVSLIKKLLKIPNH